jgi:hypothetical protein
VTTASIGATTTGLQPDTSTFYVTA